jgi:hypothetical protein
MCFGQGNKKPSWARTWNMAILASWVCLKDRVKMGQGQKHGGNVTKPLFL